MPPAIPALRRFALPAATLLTITGALGGAAAQQTDATQGAVRVRPRPLASADVQNDPAPVVRVRPRAQNGASAQAPADAAPLVPRVPRPKPINPQELSGASSGAAGATGSSGATAPSHPRARIVPGVAGTTGSSGATALSRPHPAGVYGASGTTGVRASGLGTAGHTGTQTLPRTVLPRPAAATATTPTGAATAVGASSVPVRLSTTGLNRTVIVLDPAHGGSDAGSRIKDNLLEKDVTLALALRLRSLLMARGFTVVMTRDSDLPSGTNALTLDDRAGVANHMRAAACLLLHATGRGNGLHLYTSELEAAPGETAQLPWLTAQAAWIPASQQLERNVSSALGRSHIALVSSTASIRPVDSLTCPAMVMELAPENGDPATVNDAGYQDRIAAAVAGALVFWQNQVQAPPKLNAPSSTTHTPRRKPLSSTNGGTTAGAASAAGKREP